MHYLWLFALLVGYAAFAADDDARVFADYWRGMCLLNGWGVEKDEVAAIAPLQAALRGGHRVAQAILLARK